MGLSTGAFNGTRYECGLLAGSEATRLVSSVALLALFDLEDAGGRPGGGPGKGIPGCQARLWEDDLESVCSLLGSVDPSKDTAPVEAALFEAGAPLVSLTAFIGSDFLPNCDDNVMTWDKEETETGRFRSAS